MVNNFQQGTVVAPQPILELKNHGQVLRFELSENVHRLGRDPDWADLKIRVRGWSILSRRQALLRREGDDYRIFDGDGETPSRNGLFYNQTRIDATAGLLLQDGMQLEIGLVPETRILATYHGMPVTVSQRITTIPGKLRLDLRHLQEWPVELGRAPTPNRYASMQLDAPMVSRLHARIYPQGPGQCVLQDVSTNGTFVNGQRIERKHLLQNNDLIRIGPFKLLYRDHQLTLEDTGSQIRLDAHRLVKQVQDKQGRRKKILNDISLVIEPGQLVALVGGSGAGKSTLMKSLLGIVPTTSGAVFLNGDNLRQNWGIYRSQIGYVPQDDIVHAHLTVEEVLTYACRLRLPPDTDVKAVVTKTLSQIRLSHVRHTFVRNLSGGQRKRVSIGVELLADPKLFFLDEPTSGLDPGLDKEMMRLLRELADQGRTVILVTHATANIGGCDRIVFLGRGGFLCYFGPPKETLSFFDLSDPSTQDFSDIYLKLEQGETEAETQQAIDYWTQKYLQSPDYEHYIGQILTPGKLQPSPVRQRLRTGISPWKQLGILSQRYLTLTLRDRFSQILTLIAGPIAIAFTGLILRQETPLAPLDVLEASQAPLALRLVFVFSCIAIWIGLSSAVREIVKEAAIYQRERLVNLGIFAYLGSKVLIWLGITLAQTVLMVVAIALAFAHPASNLMPWLPGLAITNFLTVLASVCLSLGISAFVKTENAANSLLPLIMIPQIIFSGVLFDLEGISQNLSWLMISRWSVGAYGTLIDVNSMVPDPVKLPDGTTLEQVFPPSPTYEATLANLGLNWGILGVHILVYLAVGLWLQKRKDVI
jgi:ABC-type multidrug transport system ATPase subunit/pSer/pThr/pTyr-binding forkhead associated (FHA) protein/ABC-type multidrug transport system permease subunit